MIRSTTKIPIKTKVGTFVLEMSAKGLYAVKFPAATSGAGDLFPLRRVMSRQKLDLSGFTPFQRNVYAVLRKIPVGKTVTYGELAKRAGYLGAARAVGTAMKKNRLPLVIPCHRVIPASGGLGEYAAGKKWKRFLLAWEKISSKSIRVSMCQGVRNAK